MEDIYKAALQAYQRISGHIVKTPVALSKYLSEQLEAEIYLKNEHVQHTGSFKLRGATNKILSLSGEEREAGVLAASTGNHGLAVAFASQRFGVRAKVIAPAKASPRKLGAIRAMGVDVETVAGDCLAAEMTAKEIARKQNRIFISPYNDPEIVAGQATIGIELDEQIPGLDAVFVAVGGGGLISGIGGVMKELNKKIKVVGCWPKNSRVMYECLKAGKIFDFPESETISDATTGGLDPGSITFDSCSRLIDDYVLVEEREIREAMKIIAREEGWIIEGAAAVPVAAALKNKESIKGKKAAIVLCGRNIDFDIFKEVICM